ncbi:MULTISPECIES: hypothetical protein [unclassified Microbacterium]|uniref:hypothetical protein n=1 Tax=unclassified Microbacterium TaxID=2609290 RepID=UPI001D97FC2C|nr:MULTISPECIES: hypothetical protein [unclassified Microbacterium]CAH0192864.1 hypothetical protein SRABI121_02288 [Microbacterium sp. Bi121]HWK78256.1 hypothetical protein [Microbacterium sp.]
MSEPALAPRNALGGVMIVWAVALVAAVVIGLAVPEEWRVTWLLIGFGGSILLSFAMQLWYGQTTGFIFRVAASTIGALVLLGVVSAGFGLAALIPA